MVRQQRRHDYTYAEYVDLEERSPVRHEYLDGEIYAMAGGTPDHAALAASILRILGSKLPAGCRAFTSDLRLRIDATGLSTYPDAAVVCGKTARSSLDPIAVTNPVLVVEVTSPSTESYDRGEKLRHYKTLPSVREIIVISHRAPEVTLHRRRDDAEWQTFEAGVHEGMELQSVGLAFEVDDLYREGLEDQA